MTESSETATSPAIREINLDRLRSGQVLARDAVHGNGRVLIAAGTILSENHLRILKAWGVYSVMIRAPEAASLDTMLPSGFDPERHQPVYEAVASRFRHTDLSHPAIAELFRLSLQKSL